jgi:hypothetical protein
MQAHESDERLSPEEQLFLKKLDQYDAQSVKKMIKGDIKQGMPVHHGQKNW